VIEDRIVELAQDPAVRHLTKVQQRDIFCADDEVGRCKVIDKRDLRLHKPPRPYVTNRPRLAQELRERHHVVAGSLVPNLPSHGVESDS
jgi:hypothetical protein